MNDEITYECLRAAGQNPNVIHEHQVLWAGCGNAGSQAVLSGAVLGITAAYVDPDHVEPRNLPHSPFLQATPLPDGSTPFKSELLAKAHVAQSRRSDQVAFWASQPLQAIPWGALRRFHALGVGIDDGPSRAWAARVGAMLGIPTIIAGFYPPTGNFVATRNHDPEAPCFFCARPSESPTREPCSRYSDDAHGVNPALQTAAAATMNVAIDVLTRFWQGDHRYDGKIFRLDLGEGTAGLSEFRRFADCAGPHEVLPESVPIELSPEEPATAVLELAKRDGLVQPVLELPSPFVLSLPCRRCGGSVTGGQPDWLVPRAPVCEGGCTHTGGAQGAQIEAHVSSGTPLAERTLRELGIGHMGYCVVECVVTERLRVYELPGTLEDVFTRVVKNGR